MIKLNVFNTIFFFVRERKIEREYLFTTVSSLMPTTVWLGYTRARRWDLSLGSLSGTEGAITCFLLGCTLVGS